MYPLGTISAGYCWCNLLKYWVGIQPGQSYLMGRRCLLTLGSPYFWWWCHKNNTLCVNVLLYWPASNPMNTSVETGWGRWKLVEVVINVDAHDFLISANLVCCLEGTGLVWVALHHVFTNNHSFSWNVMIRLQCFHYIENL